MTKPYTFAGTALKKHWARLHAGDREPYPTAQRVAKLAKSSPPVAELVRAEGGAEHVAATLEEAWRHFHHGEFLRAVTLGKTLGAAGAVVANKAAAIHALYVEKQERKRQDLLRAAIERGEEAVRQLPNDANAHYSLAMVLGRYSQRISVLEAVSAGYAGRIREHLERAATLEPKHAEAHIALGLFHAELVKTLGALAARLTFGASAEHAIEHFERAIRLTPDSAIAHLEYAHGLELLGGDERRAQADQLYSRAATFEARDRMEQLDIDHARDRGLVA